MEKTKLNLAGYQIETASNESVEMNDEYQLVKGHEISVSDADGNKLFEKLRGFMFLKKAFLIREEDGTWYLCPLKGGKKAIKKANIKIGEDKALMFDERGKMHIAQTSPYYSSFAF
jgi:hypothetical protein